MNPNAAVLAVPDLLEAGGFGLSGGT